MSSWFIFIFICLQWLLLSISEGPPNSCWVKFWIWNFEWFDYTSIIDQARDLIFHVKRENKRLWSWLIPWLNNWISVEHERNSNISPNMTKPYILTIKMGCTDWDLILIMLSNFPSHVFFSCNVSLSCFSDRTWVSDQIYLCNCYNFACLALNMVTICKFWLIISIIIYGNAL